MNVIDWLLDADPSIRWQVLRDLTDASADEVAAERACVAREGWGAQLLAAQDPDGRTNDPRSNDADVAAARVRGEEYLLERRLLRRLSNGEIGQQRWLTVSFPNAWYYDVVRVLDYLRQARPAPDDRMSEALDIVESKRRPDARWPLDHAHHDRLHVNLGEPEGGPSRWITLRALRVLRWAGR